MSLGNVILTARLLSLFFYFFPQMCSAGVLDLDTFGLSIHLGGSYNQAPMPLPIFEIGRRIYNQDVLKLGTVYAPTNHAMSATSGGGLLFMMLSYAHSF